MASAAAIGSASDRRSRGSTRAVSIIGEWTGGGGPASTTGSTIDGAVSTSRYRSSSAAISCRSAVSGGAPLVALDASGAMAAGSVTAEAGGPSSSPSSAAAVASSIGNGGGAATGGCDASPSAAAGSAATGGGNASV